VGKTLSIPNWGDRFETAQSRKVGRVTWTPFPHSFASSMRMQDPEVAAAMLQIVILAASMPKRGVFHDGGRDLSTEDIERYVGASSEVVAKAMSALGVYRKKEREREEKEGKKEVCRNPSGSSSPAGDNGLVPWFQRTWNDTVEGTLPTVRVVNKSRARAIKAFAKDAVGDRETIHRAIAAFASWPFAVAKQLDVDTFLRAKSRAKYIEWAENGPPHQHEGGGMSPSELRKYMEGRFGNAGDMDR